MLQSRPSLQGSVAFLVGLGPSLGYALHIYATLHGRVVTAALLGGLAWTCPRLSNPKPKTCWFLIYLLYDAAWQTVAVSFSLWLALGVLGDRRNEGFG